MKLKRKELFKSIRHWQVLSAVLGILLILSSFSAFSSSFGSGLSKSKAASDAVDYINNVVLQGKINAKLEDVEETNGVYKVKISINGQTLDSYVSKDGKILFPQGIDISKTQPDVSAKQEETESSDVKKSDKPRVELFVMSYCPFGLQMEKGILPVLKKLKNKINFELKFVNYAMHGEKELKENLRQYCIQKEFKNKLVPYLEKFAEAGSYEDALNTVNLKESDLKDCMNKADKEFRINEIFNDPNKKDWMGNFPKFLIDDAENKKYGVRGSPTLIINGEQVRTSRDADTLLNTICNAFNNKPDECSDDLSDLGSPSPGFGSTAGSGSTSGGCGA